MGLAPGAAPPPRRLLASTDPVPGTEAATTEQTRRAPASPDRAAMLQLGSFAERDNARRLAERLREAGVAAVDVDRVEREGRDLWRVRVGPVPAEDLAALRERLRALELPEPRVVRD